MKKRVLMIAFVLLLVSFCASLAADGSSYFNKQKLYGIECYEVPTAGDDYSVSARKTFFVPVSVYDGYAAVFKTFSVMYKNGYGLPEDAGDKIVDIYTDIWYDDDYASVCLYESDMPDIIDFWGFAAYEEEEEPWATIGDCLPDWAREMKWAMSDIAEYLAEMYDIEEGMGWYDDFDELFAYEGDDFLTAVRFVNVYFPDIKFPY